MVLTDGFSRADVCSEHTERHLRLMQARLGGSCQVRFLLRAYRSNDAPSVLRKDSCEFALPTRGRLGFASHAAADALPRSVPRISPDNDQRLRYRERLPIDTHHRDA